MLNKSKLLHQLQTLSGALFIDTRSECSSAQKIWEQIQDDPVFSQKVHALSHTLLVPHWNELLKKKYIVQSTMEPYHILSVDGSQVYPDRHQGTACFLINIGSIQIHYGCDHTPLVQFYSEPIVFPPGNELFELDSSVDIVNCLRQEYEFNRGLTQSIEINSTCSHKPFAFLFDGSLIFWHLESKDSTVRNIFLDRYISALEQFYAHKILLAGYVSLPRNKELVNLLRLFISDFGKINAPESYFKQISDATIMKFFLEPYERTIVFKNNASISHYYPDHLKPHFFYMNVGNEIARVEVPAWITYEDDTLDKICSILLDQSIKGDGYPISIAEAHEQAVVKGADREFFYQALAHIGFQNNIQVVSSQKSVKKRGMRI